MERHLPTAAVTARVLIVEDDQAQLRTLSAILGDEGFEVTGCATAAEALTLLTRDDFDVGVIDLGLPDAGNGDLLERLTKVSGRVPLIIHTGRGSYKSAKKAVNFGAFAYVEKGGDSRDVVGHVYRAIHSRITRYAEDLKEAVAAQTKELTELNRAIEESEQRLQRVVRGSNDGIWEWQDLSEDQYWWSPRFFEMLGYDDGEFTPTAEVFRELLHPDDRDRISSKTKERSEQTEPFSDEYRLRTKAGKYVWIQARGQTFCDASGRPHCMAGTVRDLTEQKQAREEIRRSEELFRCNFDHAAIGMALTDLKGNFTQVNDTTCRMLGYSKQELLTLNFRDITHSDDVQVSRNRFHDLLRGNYESYSLDKRYRRKDGQLLWGTLTVALVSDAAGKPLFAAAQLQDVTGRKQLEERLHKSETWFRSLIELSASVYAVIDASGVIVYESPSLKHWLGWQPKELVGTNVFEHVHPDDRSRLRSSLAEIIQHPEVVKTEELRYHHKDGSWRWLSVVGVNHLEEPAVRGIVLTYQDVTDRKQVEKELEEKSRFNQELIDSIPDPVFWKGRDGRYLGCNHAFAALLERPVEEVIGKTVSDLASVGLAEKYREMDRLLYDHNTRQVYEASVERADGSKRDVVFHKAPFTYPDGSMGGLIGVVLDITDRKQAENQLETALAEASWRELETALLLKASRAVLKCDHFSTAARAIFDACKEAIGATAGYVALLADDGTENEVLFLDPGGLSGTVDPPLRMPIRGLRCEAYRTTQVVYENQITASEWQDYMPEGHVDCNNVLLAPLVISGTAMGLLGLANKTNGFSDHDAELAGAFGEFASIALRNTRVEESLVDATQRLETALRSGNIGLWDWDVRTGEAHFSPEWKAQIGYQDDEIEHSKQEWESRIAPDDHERVLQALQGYIDGQLSEYAVEFRLRHKDGSYRWIYAKGEAERDEHGKPMRMLGCHVDITERKHAELQVQHLNEVLRSIRDIGELIVRERNKETLLGEACETLVRTRGYRLVWIGGIVPDSKRVFPMASAGSAADYVDVVTITWDESDTGRGPLGTALRERRTCVCQDTATDPAFTPWREPALARGCRSVAAVPMVQGGRLFGGLVVWAEHPAGFDDEELRLLNELADDLAFALQSAEDERERKRAEQELVRAKVAAETANRAKSEFLANMSHEIRTPMAAIMGFAELLLSKERPPEEQREYLTTICRNAENLLAIINDILDLSKIEAEKTEVEFVDCSPREIIEEAKMLLSDMASEKNLRFDVEYEEPIPATIRTDPGKVRQILINLLNNAIKFTDHGGVRIKVRWFPRKETEPQMRIEVADTGIGIGTEGIENLFEPFTQVDMSSTRRFGGTGLGLGISQRLAEMLGGQIDVTSEPGRGSTFSLTITAGLPGEQRQQDTTHKTMRPAVENVCRFRQGRVLLVEDAADMAKLMQRTLEQSGLELDVAENGLAACEKALASTATDVPYDLILMDIRMPVMEGFEATRRLRAAGWKGPIIALTANSMRGDREKCLAAGCDDFLAKPASQTAFFGLLDQYLGRNATTAEEEPQPVDCGKSPAEGRLFDGLLDDATVDQLLKKYSETLLLKAERLDKAIAAHDLDLVAGLAHELKGVAGTYGFPRVSEKARTLQSLARGKDEFAQIEATVRELIELCRASAQTGQDNSSRPRKQVSDR